MSRTLERARSMMAPGNPVPPDAFGDSWNDPSGHATFRQIVALPSDGAPGQGHRAGAVLRDSSPRARHRFAARRILAPAAVVAMLIAAGAVLASRPATGPGQMATAPMLTYTLSGVSAPVKARQLPPARSLLLHLAKVAERQPAVQPPPGADVGYVLTNEWYMSVAVAGGTNTVAVIPQVDQTWTAPNGTDRQVQRNGKPWVGPVGSQLTLRAAESGPPVSDLTFRTAEEFGPLVRSLSGNPARLQAQLMRASTYHGDPSPPLPAYQLIKIITDLHHQVVQPWLEAALWRVLAGQRDVRDLGTVVDRAGRMGDAVATTVGGDGNERLVLIISPSTGRLLGEEDIFLTNPGALNIRTFPMVTSYVAYLTEGWTTSTNKPSS
jgi:hypothetical protein